MDLFEQRFGLLLHLVRERLDVVRTTEGIDDIGDAGLVRQDLLRPERNLHGVLSRKRERLVH